jgi:cell division protein FtsN
MTRSMKNQRGGFVLGMVVGLLIGLALALAVALYITKVPIPFVNKVHQRTAEQDAAEAAKNRNWDPNAPLAGRTLARPAPPAASGAVSPPPDAASAPPQRASLAMRGVGARVMERASAARAARDPAAILAGQAAARSTAGGADPFSYFVQAGAYSRPDDAEQQRARLAMMGVGARVMEREQSGRMVYRVRVGPFDGRDEAETMQSRLATSGVEASLVRVER